MKYKLVVTKPAENDLSDIAKYIAGELAAPKAASDFLDEVANCCENVSLNPLMYPLCENQKLHDKGYRKALVKNYIMFYRVDETSGTIFIMRFIYGGRDYINIL